MTTVPSDMAIRDAPGTALTFASEVEQGKAKAQVLKQIVVECGLARKIGQSEHLNIEAWTTIAKGYGYTPLIEWSRKLPDGGWEARAVLIDPSGNKVSAAEAECGTEGDANWVGRPSFQQRSMAETRAVSKVCRLCLSWVVVLAGYSATPYEEMDGVVPKADQPARADISNISKQTYCAEHKTDWFVRGSMTNHAHPIEGTKDPRTGKSRWCRMPEEAKAPPAAPQSATGAPTEPDPVDSDDVPPRSLAQLFAAAYNRLKMTRTETLDALGVSDPQGIGNIADAWVLLTTTRVKKLAQKEADKAATQGELTTILTDELVV